jgi:hypothetical protein
MFPMSHRPGSSRARAAAWSRRVVTLAALASIPLHGGCGAGTSADPPDASSPAPMPDARTITFPRASCDAPLAPAAEPPPGVHIVFPPAPGLTHEAAITVRGTAVLDAGVAAIRVNGVAAQSADGFRTWKATVPLAPGENTLVVESEDSAGQIDPAAAQATVVSDPEPLRAPLAVDVDAPGNRALVIDTALGAVVAVDLATGARSIVFGPPTAGDVGAQLSPPSPDELRGLAVHEQRLLVLGAGQLFEVDLATGAATMLSDGFTGSGPQFVSLADMAVDAAGDRALVLDYWEHALLAVDLTTGARTVIANDATGSGPSLGLASALALDAQAGRALVVEREFGTLLAVNLATGARTVLSGPDVGSGEALLDPQDIVLDAVNQRALIASWGNGNIIAVDLRTGDRTRISDVSTTSGPLLEQPMRLALDAAQGRLLVIDSERHALLGVDLETEARTLIAGDAIGSGPEMRDPSALVLDPEARRVLVHDDGQPALLAIELATGARTVLSSDTVGGGVDLTAVRALAVDSSQAGRQRVLAASAMENANAIVAVDLATGERTVLSGAGVGTGPALDLPQPLIVDPARNRALAGMQTGLVAVDLDTGDRTLLSADVGEIHLLAMEPECNRVLLGEGAYTQGLLALELETERLALIAKYDTCPRFPVWPPELSFHEPATGRVVIDHELPAQQMVIDTRAGTCTEESSTEPGAGHTPYFGREAVRDPATGLLFLVTYAKSFEVVDPETGAHVILSR